MPFPEKVPVKISSEAAGAISITPVVRRDMSVAELIASIVGVTGKDAARIREVLHQGVLVSGASRFRWAPIEAGIEEIAPQLATFPDPRPDRPFDPAKCKRAALSGGRATIDFPRDAASRKALFGRRSFWQELMEVASQRPPVYHQYSYSESADVYWLDLPLETVRALQARAGLLQYSSLEAQVREHSFNRLELWVER